MYLVSSVLTPWGYKQTDIISSITRGAELSQCKSVWSEAVWQKKVERNRVTKLGYLSYFKSSVSVSLRSGSKYSSPSSTQNKAPAPGLKSTYIMSSLFKSSSISPSGADLRCHPPSLFRRSFILFGPLHLFTCCCQYKVICL